MENTTWFDLTWSLYLFACLISITRSAYGTREFTHESESEHWNKSKLYLGSDRIRNSMDALRNFWSCSELTEFIAL